MRLRYCTYQRMSRQSSARHRGLELCDRGVLELLMRTRSPRAFGEAADDERPGGRGCAKTQQLAPVDRCVDE